METPIHIGCGVTEKFEQFGKYLLLEKLATGGMAEVFLARATAASGISKVVAIKRILPQFAESPEFIDMFKDEARIVLNLKHSNIVSIFDFGVHSGQFYLVMEYVEGRNLRQLLNKLKKTNQRLSIEQVIFLVKEVAAGLEHAHRCIDGSTGKPLNITHRDMSPQNVMVSFDCEVKIVDFGIAKAETQLETTRAGTLKGKFGYMSPEQAEGNPIDLRTDIFSLGIVLWELLANDRLFIASNELNTLRKIRDCQVPSLRKINPNIPNELERIAIKALARDRNLRYQTAAAMHRDLNRFLNRQFPEFSQQDFASFIKNQFADEIYSTRQRLVEYGKIPLAEYNTGSGQVQNPGPSKELFVPKGTVDRNLSSQTDSMVVSAPTMAPAETAARPLPDPAPIAITGTFPPTANKATDSFSAYSNPDFDFHNNPQPKSSDNEPGNEDSTRITPLVTAENLLDDQALTKELSRARIARPSHYGAATEVTDPSYNSRSKSSIRSQPRRRQPKKKPFLSSQISTIITVAALLFTAYGYLAKMQIPALRPLVIGLDPYLRPLHRMMGIQMEQKNLGSQKPNAVTENTSPIPNEIPEPAAQPVAAVIKPPPPVAPIKIEEPKPVEPTPTEPQQAIEHDPSPMVDSEPKETILVTSNPSGAEIWINGRNTGELTPSRIEVPARREFSVAFKRNGFLDYRRSGLTKAIVGSRLAGSLQQAMVGYLDIDVVPPQNVVIFINGRELRDEHLPISGYAVPAETSIVVRAEDSKGEASAQQVVKVQRDRRVTVVLNLRNTSAKKDRQPSRSR